MKKIILIICLLPIFAFSQVSYKIIADSTILKSISTNSNELVIRNSTKDTTTSVLYNNGNGVTQFKKVRVIGLNDSTYVVKIGTLVVGDTIKIHGQQSLGGTVTSVATDVTLTGGPIISSGTLKVDTTIISTKNYALNIGNNKATFSALNDSITAVRSIRKVDTIYKNTGGDSIVYTINGLRASILDRQNTGTVTSVTASSPLASSGGNTPNVTADTSILSTKGNVTGLLLNKQDNLISGTTIKTINSTSLLGSGNITTPDAQTLSTSYGSDSITLSISGGNSIKFAYAVDSVGMVSTDSLITYKAGVRRSYKVGSTGGGGALSAITAATATNTIDNTNYKQRWNWSTTAGDTALVITSNSTAAASNLQTVVSIENKGANATSSQTTFGLKVANLKTGTSTINYGIYAKASGGGSNYSVAADGDFFCIGGKYRWQSGAYIDDGSALTLYAGTNHAVFITPTKAEGVDILTSAGYISHNFYEVSGTDAGIIMGGRYNAGTYDPFSTTAIVQLQRQSGKLNFIAATGLAGSYTPSSYTIMTVNGTTSGAAGNVGIGTTSPSANAKLEITTTTLAPIKLTPMTATQASAVTAEDGQILYVNSTNGTFTSVGFWGRENGVWVKL